MNILILANPAKNYKTFFYNLGCALAEQEHQIFFAVDSQKSRILTPIPEMDNGKNTYYFDVYFSENQGKVPNKALFDTTWGEYFYSDFDRFLTRDFNLNRDSNYWNQVRYCLDSFFHKIISENSIDLVIYENISNSFEYSAYRVCKQLGKQYFGLISARIPNRFEILTSIIGEQLSELKIASQQEPTQQDIDWFESYSKELAHIEPDYMKSHGVGNVSVLDKINRYYWIKIIRSLRADWIYSSEYDYASHSLMLRLVSSIKNAVNRRINAYRCRHFFLSEDEINVSKEHDNFYVYPMHYHPESSTSVLAPQYTDEFHNILNISNNLPFGSYLYVKEHRSAIGIVDRKTYRKIKALPAVKLISSDYNIKRLIASSQGVITVNSTAGYEGVILGKPVFLLGRVFYQNFKNVIKLENFETLKTVLKQKHAIHSNLRDVVAYKNITFQGALNFKQEDYAQNADYYDDIAKCVILKYQQVNISSLNKN